jgi:hypothetical protein
MNLDLVKKGDLIFFCRDYELYNTIIIDYTDDGWIKTFEGYEFHIGDLHKYFFLDFNLFKKEVIDQLQSMEKRLINLGLI